MVSYLLVFGAWLTVQFPPKGFSQDLAAAYASYKVIIPLPKLNSCSSQRMQELHADPESQFMVGFFHATGLGGVEQDQGKVGIPGLSTACIHLTSRLCYFTHSQRFKGIARRPWQWGIVTGRELVFRRYITNRSTSRSDLRTV